MKKTRCPKNTTVLLLCYVVVILSAQVSMALSLRLSKILQKNDEEKVEKQDEQAQDWLVYYFIIFFLSVVLQTGYICKFVLYFFWFICLSRYLFTHIYKNIYECK